MHQQVARDLTLCFFLQLVHTFSLELTPLCLELQEDGTERNSCESIIRFSGESQIPERWMECKAKLLEGVTTSNAIYSNATIIFKTISEIDTLAIGRKDETSNRTIWVLNPNINVRTMFPMIFKIAFIPHPTKMIYIRKQSTTYSLDSICGTESVFKECYNLQTSQIDIKRLDSNASIILSLRSRDVIEGLFVEIITGSCPLHCDFGISTCNAPVNVTYAVLRNSTQSIILEHPRTNNYCFRVAPREECCWISSENVVISFNPDNKFVIEFLLDSPYKYLIWFVTILAFILVGYILLAQHIWKSSSFNSESTVESLLTSSKENKLEQDECSESLLTDVLLLYLNDCSNFQYLMKTFQNVLKLYVNKVWDPNDEDIMEIVHENWWQWLENVFKIPNLKVIIVETDKSRAWIANHFKQDAIPSHYLDGLFYYAINRLKDDHYLCRDYKRVFRVRFDKHRYMAERNNIIVPCTCYEMPQHLVYLIGDLLGGQSNMETGNGAYVKEMEIFLETFRNFTGRCEINT